MTDSPPANLARPLRQVVLAHAVSEGAGVTVQRAIGTPALRQLDPFLMLDRFGSNDPHTDVRYFDLRLDPGERVELPLPATHAGFVYVYEGNARIAGQALARHSLGVLGAGETVEIDAGDDGARLILVAGRPLGESIVQYGPFVMNTREEIEQAFADYRDGRLASQKAHMIGA